MLKAVIDANVFISALLNSEGNPRKVLTCLESSVFSFYYPKQLIQELRNAPSKPRLAAKVKVPQVERLIDLIDRKGFHIEPQHVPPVSRDPKDDVFLACAREAQADFLVTGDADLLTLGQHDRTKIVTARQFLDALTK